MDPLTMTGVGISIGSTLLGLGSTLTGNKRARKAAQRQSQLTFMQRQEENRRLKDEYQDILGYNEAAIYASNLQNTGSPALALQQMEAEFAKDISQRRNAAVLERSAIKAGAPGSGSDIGALASAGANIGSTLIGIG